MINSRWGSIEIPHRWTVEISPRSQGLVTAVDSRIGVIDAIFFFLFPFFFCLFLSHFTSTFDIMYTCLLVGINSVECAAQRKRVAAIRSNVFFANLFFRNPCFWLRDTRVSAWTFRLLATMRDTEGTKFPKACNSKHREWNPSPRRYFIRYKRIPVLPRDTFHVCNRLSGTQKSYARTTAYSGSIERLCNNTSFCVITQKDPSAKNEK